MKSNQRKCYKEGCGVWAHWRRMRCHRIFREYEGEGTQAGDRAAFQKDPSLIYGEYYYECAACVSKAEGCTLREAERLVKQPRTQKHLLRSQQFQFAMDHAVEFFPMLKAKGEDEEGKEDGDGAEDKKAKRIKYTTVVKSMKTMKNFFGPMLQALSEKLVDEINALKAAKAFQQWSENSEAANDAEIGLKVDEELEKATQVWRAFSNFANQAEMCRAADYADKWYETNTGEKFTTFYCCRAHGMGTENECGALIPSEVWGRLHEDPEASGQRWYCNLCQLLWRQQCKYKTKYGVVIEMRMKSAEGVLEYMYCWAELPPQGVQDTKCMMIEQQYALKPGITAKELLAALPRCRPECETLIEETAAKDTYKFKNLQIKDLPVFAWNQLFNLVKSDVK
jgi:hypothetical protein